MAGAELKVKAKAAQHGFEIQIKIACSMPVFFTKL
jgi:hypothetical protein